MKSFWLVAVVLIFCHCPSFALADELDFLSFGAEGELYLPVPMENSVEDGDRLRIRSAELTSLADFDDWLPGLHAKLNVGGEDLTGSFVLNIREGYVEATDLLARGLDLRAGKFYLPVGLLNQTRRSAWAFLSPPRAISLFFTDNGVVDSGFDLVYHADHFAVRVGVSNGYSFDSGISNGGDRPQSPTTFARPELWFGIAGHELTAALDYLGRVDNDGDAMRLAGLDLQWTPKDDTDAATAWSGQLEAYHRYQNPASQGLAIVEELGGYAYAERGLGEKFAGGLRFDAYKIPSLTDEQGQNRKNFIYGLTPVFTYRGREHLRLQASYTYSKETRDGDANRSEQLFEIRLVSEFGDIPKFRTPLRDRSSL